MTGNPYRNQIQNRNFLSPVGFKFTLNRAPKTAYFSNNATIPGITLGVANQPNYLTDIPTPGDKMQFEDFTIRFLVDEDLTNYMEIQNWMRGLGFPESLSQIYDLQEDKDNYTKNVRTGMNIYSDGTLMILTSNLNTNFKVIFKDMFPYQLSQLNFDATATDVEYFTADVSFKYMMYNIVGKHDEEL